MLGLAAGWESRTTAQGRGCTLTNKLGGVCCRNWELGMAFWERGGTRWLGAGTAERAGACSAYCCRSLASVSLFLPDPAAPLPALVTLPTSPSPLCPAPAGTPSSSGRSPRPGLLSPRPGAAGRSPLPAIILETQFEATGSDVASPLSIERGSISSPTGSTQKKSKGLFHKLKKSVKHFTETIKRKVSSSSLMQGSVAGSGPATPSGSSVGPGGTLSTASSAAVPLTGGMKRASGSKKGGVRFALDSPVKRSEGGKEGEAEPGPSSVGLPPTLRLPDTEPTPGRSEEGSVGGGGRLALRTTGGRTRRGSHVRFVDGSPVSSPTTKSFTGMRSQNRLTAPRQSPEEALLSKIVGRQASVLYPLSSLQSQPSDEATQPLSVILRQRSSTGDALMGQLGQLSALRQRSVAALDSYPLGVGAPRPPGLTVPEAYPMGHMGQLSSRSGQSDHQELTSEVS